MSKNISLRLNDQSAERLENLKEYYNNRPEYKDVTNMSYNDIIQLALRALSEDNDLE